MRRASDRANRFIAVAVLVVGAAPLCAPRGGLAQDARAGEPKVETGAPAKELLDEPPPRDPMDVTDDGVPDEADNCIEVANPDQRDTHGDGYGNVCDPDLDNDGNVNTADLGLLKGAFFATGPGLDADFNGDGVVNSVDLGVMKAYFFGPPGPSGVAIE